MTVEVSPATFSLVDFDAATIARLAVEVAGLVGVDRHLTVEVDESTPLMRAAVASLDPLVVAVQSGAFEDPKRPRQLSPDRVREVLGRLLMRVHDRLDPAFGDPPPDDELSPAVSAAWDAYCAGRCRRLGLPAQEQRRRYHFRNRHGFTDDADAAFDRLWHGEGLTWSDVGRSLTPSLS